MTERIRPQCAAKISLRENVLRAFNAVQTKCAFEMSKNFNSDTNLGIFVTSGVCISNTLQ
jgi:hypothetical protein